MGLEEIDVSLWQLDKSSKEISTWSVSPCQFMACLVLCLSLVCLRFSLAHGTKQARC